jgi:hypothetical protein
VFPKAQNAIQNVTELLDLNFNVLEFESVNYIGVEKSTYLKSVYYHLEIDEVKREKYVREVDRWLKLVPNSNWTLIMYELVSATNRNAWIISAPYHIQTYLLNIMNEIIYPLSCHFVKRPFAHQFKELYFLNPKAEEFKSWTTKFLDHGLFERWTRLESHSYTLSQRRLSLGLRSKIPKANPSRAPDTSNFVGQVHLMVFYNLISTLTTICVAIFLLECAMQNTRELSLFLVTKVKHFSLQLLWTTFRSLYLMSRPIGRFYSIHNPF